MLNVYSHILEGNEATEENAKSCAMGLDWQEIETSEQNIKYYNFIETINGVGIYYDFRADYYFFTDKTV